jgi:predicted enzyme related to lactoylglutathione lyase
MGAELSEVDIRKTTEIVRRLSEDFLVENIDAAVQRAVAAGARLEKPPVTHKWGKLALMADPFGHGFCFVQFLGRGYDEIAD